MKIFDNKKFTDGFLTTLSCTLMLVTTGVFFYTFTHYEISPGAYRNFAYGQTGATGPTGPTGATGHTGATGSTGVSVFNGHTVFGGSAPTITNCGTGPTDANANDNAGTVIIGKNSLNNLGTVIPVMQCTVTFATAFSHAPSINFTTNQRGLYVTYAGISTTAVTMYFSKDASQAQVSYTAF
jgi:hypothetical protein